MTGESDTTGADDAPARPARSGDRLHADSPAKSTGTRPDDTRCTVHAFVAFIARTYHALPRPRGLPEGAVSVQSRTHRTTRTAAILVRSTPTGPREAQSEPLLSITMQTNPAHAHLLLPEREGALAAVAELRVENGGWFRRRTRLGAIQAERVESLAAIVLSGEGVRRDSWTRPADLSEAELTRLTNAKPPVREIIGRSFQRIDNPATGVPMRCTNCAVRPGLGPCPRCVGTGRLLQRDDQGNDTWGSCICDGGFVRCAMCGGSLRVVRVTVRSVTDTVVPVQEWVLPQIAIAATGTLQRLGAPSPLERYLCSLESERVESAYRGTGHVVTPSFCGFELLDAADRARERLAQLAGRLHVHDAKPYAVPFLFLRFSIGGKPAHAVVRRSTLGYAAELC